MSDETLKQDLIHIYYALQLVFTRKQADAIMNRLAKKLKNSKTWLSVYGFNVFLFIHNC